MLQNCYTLLLGSLLLSLCFLKVNPVSAQDTLTVQYSLNARGTFKEGQLNQIILSIDGYYALTAQYWRAELFTHYSYLKTNGRVGENELLGRALISILPQKSVFPVIGYIYNKSEFYQIQRRHTPGIGIGWRLLKNQSTSLELYAWAAYDDTDFKNIPGYTTFRINTFVVGDHALIPDKLRLQYVLYYLQSLEVSNNYIWRIEPGFLLQLSRQFSLSVNFQSHFENIIDPANTKRNSVMTVGLKFQNF